MRATLAALAWAVAVLLAMAPAWDHALDTLRDVAPAVSPSLHDGRERPCGVVDEHGVTEHLDAFRDRCPGG